MNSDRSFDDSGVAGPEREPLLERELTSRIIGAFYDVYNDLGPGFLESVYQESMRIALDDVGVVAIREVPIAVSFRGRCVGTFRADLIADRRVLIELKVARALETTHESQIVHYLKATRIEVALLFNFGPRPTMRRFVMRNALKDRTTDPR